MKSKVAWLLAACMAAGCSSGPRDAVARGDGDANPSITNDQSGGSKPQPTSPNGVGEPSIGEGARGKDGASQPIPPKPKISEPQKVQQPGTGQWSATKLTPNELAAKVAKAMGSVTGTECQSMLSIKTPEGVGKNVLSYKFSTPNAFRVEYVEPGLIPKRGTILADGQQVKAYRANQWTAPKPVAKGLDPAQASVTAEKFLTQFPRAMLSNAVDKSDPWKGLFADLQSPNSTFDSRVEERRYLANGRTYLSYRIVAIRKKSAAARLGPASMEVVIDGKYWLPVTIRTEKTAPGGKPWMYEWTGMWRFKQNFSKDDLQFTQKRPSA